MLHSEVFDTLLACGGGYVRAIFQSLKIETMVYHAVSVNPAPFSFLPLGLKAQRGITIMVAGGRSGGRAHFPLTPFFFAIAFPIDAKICTRTNLTAVSVIVRPDF